MVDCLGLGTIVGERVNRCNGKLLSGVKCDPFQANKRIYFGAYHSHEDVKRQVRSAHFLSCIAERYPLHVRDPRWRRPGPWRHSTSPYLPYRGRCPLRRQGLPARDGSSPALFLVLQLTKYVFATLPAMQQHQLDLLVLQMRAMIVLLKRVRSHWQVMTSQEK